MVQHEPIRDGSDFRNQMCAVGARELDVSHALTGGLSTA